MAVLVWGFLGVMFALWLAGTRKGKQRRVQQKSKRSFNKRAANSLAGEWCFYPEKWSGKRKILGSGNYDPLLGRTSWVEVDISTPSDPRATYIASRLDKAPGCFIKINPTNKRSPWLIVHEKLPGARSIKELVDLKTFHNSFAPKLADEEKKQAHNDFRVIGDIIKDLLPQRSQPKQ